MSELQKSLRLPQANLRINTSNIAEPELVREFFETIENWGHRVLYIRADNNVHCECWDPVANQPSGGAECIVCYGTGFRIQVERHLFRKFTESTPGRLAQSSEQVTPGKVYTSLRSGFMKPAVRPRPDDLIIRVEWNPATERPIDIIEVLRITDIDDMREEQGVLAFWKVYCDTLSINRILFERKVRIEDRIIVID